MMRSFAIVFIYTNIHLRMDELVVNARERVRVE